MARATEVGAGMNGSHDLGGIGGLGPIPIEEDEPVFAEPWEGRVLAMSLSGVVTGTYTVDHHKAAAEGMPPVAFMGTGYWEQWLHALEACLVDAGAVSRAEIEARTAELGDDPDAPLPSGHNDELTESVRWLLANGVPRAELDPEPRFRPGDQVETRVIRVTPGEEHTSMPAYAQAKRGVVELAHRPEPLGDSVVAGEGMNPEYVYAVRFRACELWPDAGERDTVVVDLFESYMEAAA